MIGQDKLKQVVTNDNYRRSPQENENKLGRVGAEKYFQTIGDAIDKIRENPRVIIGEMRKYGTKLNVAIHSHLEKDDFDVIAEEWDTLVILDACRADAYQEAAPKRGKLETRQSLASESREFMKENFMGRTLHDIVYVTSNGFSLEIPDGTFHAHRSLLSKWDEELQTVRPEVVADASRTAHQEFPDKRVIVHFMQPHYPFIGPLGQSIDHRGYKPDETVGDAPNIWDALQFGRLDNANEADVWEAYEENLELVLKEVESLIKDIDGRVCITSDHGNMIGDRSHPIPVKTYGHPQGLRTPELVEVPWHVIKNGPRREVTSESPVESPNELDDQTVSDRLRALGYQE